MGRAGVGWGGRGILSRVVGKDILRRLHLGEEQKEIREFSKDLPLVKAFWPKEIACTKAPR